MPNGIIVPFDANFKYSNGSEVLVGSYDGKPLYRKIFELSGVNIQAGVDYIVTTGLTNINPLEITGTLYQTDGSKVGLGFYYSSSIYGTSFISSSGNLIVKSGSAANGVIINILYYKTT